MYISFCKQLFSAIFVYGTILKSRHVCNIVTIHSLQFVAFLFILLQGGTLVNYDGKIRLLELAQVPKDKV